MIEFRSEDHTYWFNGALVPGVTTILKPISPYGSVPREILAVKAALGTAVHAACDLDDQGILDESSITSEMMAYVDAWRAFKREFGIVLDLNETTLFNQTHWYAGTLDNVVFSDDGTRWLVDKKTSAVLQPTVGPQTAAYAHALGEPDVKRGVVQLRPDGTYRFVVLNDAMDWPTFLACLTIHKWKEKHDV